MNTPKNFDRHGNPVRMSVPDEAPAEVPEWWSYHFCVECAATDPKRVKRSRDRLVEYTHTFASLDEYDAAMNEWMPIFPNSNAMICPDCAEIAREENERC